MGKKNTTAKKSILKVRQKRKEIPSEEKLVHGILNGDRALLARGITLVESTRPEDFGKARKVINQCLAHSADSIRIGITGVPGVGKSTFIEAFGKFLIAQGKKVAILAIDPTSTVSKGSILGDKTRMNELVKNPMAFIRPSPSSEALGGVARKSRETMILCEAAGFDVILIETVGVGQSESTVHSMVDFFLLLQLTGAGDELQGIKRGIIEMADALVINKADGTNVKSAEKAKAEFNRALHHYPPKQNGWIPKVMTSSALEETGIPEIWEMINEYIDHSKKTGFFTENRRQQNRSWFLQTIEARLKQHFYNDTRVKKHLARLLQEVTDAKVSPFDAAETLLQTFEKQ
ncbi:MAG: methylmalonyl Co-A mutase-associated GTPase MeaB [Flavobacteriaceae bacterium]